MSFDLNQTEDQRQIHDACRAMLAEHYPLSRLRGPATAESLAPLVAFGAFAFALPEAHGGAGFTLLDEALLHVQLGRHLISPAALAAPIAARIALDNGQLEQAVKITEGQTSVSAMVKTKNGILLLGNGAAVLGIIRQHDTMQLIDISQVNRDRKAAMAQGQPIFAIASLPAPKSNNVAKAQTSQTAQILVSAQLLGVAEGARDLAVEYAKIREQFGRPIGSFQAIKHHCANMALGVEKLSAQLDMAAIAVGKQSEDAAFQTAALARIAPNVALENARICIQIHGGIGFSAEADAHLFLKQAHVLRQLIGQTDFLALPAPMAPTREDT
ncbi:MAG: acyl-CoA/acyl-ACP dehydrogenase [Rhodobacteraceae bacterium]|nr:acyl-CoA/acyl-ACP dehydrogenase [Paracoccaceae bacterium]PHR55651.1 MAG: hypothetical protein COA47_13780 [Robiginitomaculum sp.]